MVTPVLRFTLLLLASVALFAACGEDDNPIVENGHDDEPFHADADGFVLKVDGNEIYRQFEGTHTGGITLKVGEELDVLTAFLDHDSHEFFPENPEEEDDHDHDHEHGEEEVFALALSGYDSSIIEVHLYHDDHGDHDDDDDHDDHDDHDERDDHDEHDDDDDHDEHEEHDEHGDELAEQFTFEVKGLKAGQTEIKLQLMHGDHPDFTAALLIPVTVTP